VDHQRPYLELIFGFIGFTDIWTLAVEPTLAPGADDTRTITTAAAQAAGQRLYPKSNTPTAKALARIIRE
jgi:FMN-dependent NADH-azoreductase